MSQIADPEILHKLDLMQRSMQVMTDSGLSLEEQIDGLLKEGCDMFGEDLGILSRIEGNRYIVQRVHDPSGAVLLGQEYEVAYTFCSITLQADGPLGISDVKNSPYRSHPCIRTQLESYIGVPVLVDGRRFGTLNFSSTTPRTKPFLDADLDFVKTLADWVGLVLSRYGMIETLVLQANNDPLTGLRNRASFEKRLESSIKRGLNAEDYSFALMFIDLDKFKAANDSYGHQAGDAVLRETARKLEEQIRPRDGAARLGGDEFVVLLEDVGIDDALTIASRVRTAIKRPIAYERNEISVDASIGIAVNAEYEDARSFIEAADAAMYHAKQSKLGICAISREELTCPEAETAS